MNWLKLNKIENHTSYEHVFNNNNKKKIGRKKEICKLGSLHDKFNLPSKVSQFIVTNEIDEKLKLKFSRSFKLQSFSLLISQNVNA